MNRDTLRQSINVLATLALLVVNGLANALPLNGKQTGAISDSFDVRFTPAGYVFAIWGVIYVGLLAFAIYQALPAQRENPRLRRIGYLYALSCLANCAWIFLWHYEFFPLTVVAMVALLLSLIDIYMQMDINLAPVSRAETWCVDVPFSVYLGWITVATVANVTVLLDYLHWNGWGIAPETWAVVMLVTATGITALVSITRRDIGFAAVLVWAFIGIAVKQFNSPEVSGAALVLAVTMVITLVWGIVIYRRKGK
jgi:hypothetical protein